MLCFVGLQSSHKKGKKVPLIPYSDFKVKANVFNNFFASQVLFLITRSILLIQK